MYEKRMLLITFMYCFDASGLKTHRRYHVYKSKQDNNYFQNYKIELLFDKLNGCINTVQTIFAASHDIITKVEN